MSEQYRFERGHLYEYSADHQAYIHCYTTTARTKRAAVAEYEASTNSNDDVYESRYYSE